MKRGAESQDLCESSQHARRADVSTQSSPYALFEASEPHFDWEDEWPATSSEAARITLNDDDQVELEGWDAMGVDNAYWSDTVGGASVESWAVQELSDKHEGAPLTHADAVRDTLDGQSLECYGTVYLAKVQLKGDMSTVLKALKRPDVRQTASGSHLLLEILAEDEEPAFTTNVSSKRLYVKINSHLRLAQLSNHLSESLTQLVHSGAIHLEAVIHRSSLFDDIGSATRQKGAQTTVNINVYGLCFSAFNTGRHFSKNKIWLQRPVWYRPDCKYNNPHVVKVDVVVDELPDISITDESGAESVQNSMQKVYSMLTRDTHLDHDTVEHRHLQTTLLPHQVKAHKFMTQREIGPIPSQFELWEAVHKDDQTWYRHKIVGVKSQSRPTETGGGIIADEMGMGKTFTMLSMIVTSLDAACSWSGDEETRLTDNIRPSKQLSRATLIVVPSSLLISTWTDEIRTRLNIDLKVFVHHGRQRPVNARSLSDNDIVLTTYHTLIADHNRQRNPIPGIAWYRIVLDEAHVIRTATTHLHKRVAELDAKYRWCVTGTPVQNRLDDFGALLAFLRIFPFDRMNVFRQCVSVPFREKGFQRVKAQEDLAKLFDALCIRRTNKLLNLDNFEHVKCEVELSLSEREQYDKTQDAMTRAMRHDAAESVSNNRFGIFQAQLQLRLLCNHGTYQQQFHWRKRNLLNAMKAADPLFVTTDNEGICSGCEDPIPYIELAKARTVQQACTHMLCQDCRQGVGPDCPFCELIVSAQRHDRVDSRSRTCQARAEYFRTSGQCSKMDALVRDLQRTSPEDKSIVFSQWTITLDLVGRHLEQHGIRFARIDGSHEHAHRIQTLEAFQSQDKYRILIMTIGVGAVGLNLTAANRVYLVEPQWNPSTELQAIGRTLRIGQRRRVTITRYIVKDTVEQSILQIQQRKLNMAGI